jgi:hypothetical protein
MAINQEGLVRPPSDEKGFEYGSAAPHRVPTRTAAVCALLLVFDCGAANTCLPT